MPPLRSTEDLYRSIRRTSVKARLVARGEWSTIDPSGDWLTQWQRRLPRLVAAVYTAQVQTATDGSAAVARGLVEAGHPEKQLAAVSPKAFGGWVTPSWNEDDGVDLAAYLTTPVTQARNASGGERSMLAAGGNLLDSLVQFAVVDAAAHAHDAQVVATENTYSVFVEPGSMCQRCAVLVGKRYRPGTHVKRHPNCDGVMEVRSESAVYLPDHVPVSRIKDLTIAQQTSIDAGADVTQVINAKRNKKIGIYTLEGTTRRGWAHFAMTTRHGAYSATQDRKRPNARYASTTLGRLTPEAIYKLAKDRADMVRLLRIYGYVI